MMWQAGKETKDETPTISLHTIFGTHASQTMWAKGNLGHQADTVLIDFGSTHNFLNHKLAKGLLYDLFKEGSLKLQWPVERN